MASCSGRFWLAARKTAAAVARAFPSRASGAIFWRQPARPWPGPHRWQELLQAWDTEASNSQVNSDLGHRSRTSSAWFLSGSADENKLNSSACISSYASAGK
ncbi:hypothetical protein PAHAL_6G026500 [Panicum hallii]|uniref:Uncharacterized protein n=1 Tax=Panicum hallii TaxID=206008 RepID=A0A2T8IEX8_9POAL|nr:hypothetical protein PAHAL_6G026500 [Panicum hallii]